MVQYLHFRILKFPLTKTSVSGDSNGSLGSHPRFDSWLEKYAPDGPYMKEMTELEKEIVQTYPSYDAEAAIKQHAEFAAGWWLFNIGSHEWLLNPCCLNITNREFPCNCE